MKKILFYCYSLSLTINSIAQESLTKHYTEQSKICGGIEEVLKIKGTWKRVEDDLAFPDKTFPTNQYKFINSRLDTILKIFKEAYPNANGMEPRWQRAMRGKSFTLNGPPPYSFTSLYLEYYCNTNYRKIILGDETSTWAYVFVNHYNWFCKFIDSWDISSDGRKIDLYLLPQKVGKWKGLTLYEPGTHGKFSRAVVIGHDGKLPWHTITQIQYLTGLKNLLEAKKKQAMDHHNSYEETLKKNMARPLKNVTPEQAAKIREQQEKDLKTYQSKQAGYKENSEKFFDEKLKPVYDYLAANTEETLKQPAILDPRSGIEGFKGHFGDEDNGGMKLVAFSSKYFKPDLPRYVPQFMILYWRWNDYPSSLDFKKQFEENFPIEKLKAMIDK